MPKKHLFSAYTDFKTGIFYKSFLFLGFVLIIIYLVETLFHLIGFNENSSGTILAFSILCIGLGLILYFFSRQFTKLSQIAKEIEQDESFIDEEEIKKQT